MATRKRKPTKQKRETKHPGGRGDCNAPRKKWRVLDRHCNYSAFNGGRYTPSDYSLCKCMACGTHWRTKADYVALLADATAKERFK